MVLSEMARRKRIPLAPRPPEVTSSKLKNRGHKPSKRVEFINLWRRGVKCSVIAATIHISERTAFLWQKNLYRYQSIKCPIELPIGRPRKLTVADKNALYDHLVENGWSYLDEMKEFLLEERGVDVSLATISELLSSNNWTRKQLKLVARDRSELMRTEYLYEMRAFQAEDLIFLDESIFNEKTGWRKKAYAPIGNEARYQTDINRGRTWSILPAMSIDGYLPCTAIREGYFKTEDICEWITTQLLPAIAERYGARPMVLVLDNVSVHVADEVTQPIVNAGHLIKYLPPYSPDFNPIEMSFSVLKAWIRRHYWHQRGEFGSFGDWLRHAVSASECDRFAANQFRHAAGGIYLREEQFDEVRDQIRQLSRREVESEEQ
jgi:transposase